MAHLNGQGHQSHRYRLIGTLPVLCALLCLVIYEAQRGIRNVAPPALTAIRAAARKAFPSAAPTAVPKVKPTMADIPARAWAYPPSPGALMTPEVWSTVSVPFAMVTATASLTGGWDVRACDQTVLINAQGQVSSKDVTAAIQHIPKVGGTLCFKTRQDPAPLATEELNSQEDR